MDVPQDGQHAGNRLRLFLVALALSGCVQEAKLVQVTADGGVVTYPLKRDAVSIFSPYRTEAFSLIEHHCLGKYAIVREGETKSVSYAPGLEGEDPIVTKRYWGIQFRCQVGGKLENDQK